MNTFNILIKSSEEHKEFLTEEDCYILEILNETDDRSQSIARARIEPGITTKWHQLKDTSEVFYILSGEGRVEIGDEKFWEVKAGDVVRIPANTPQRMVNVGTKDLLFLCFCTPAFGEESYEALE